MHPTSPARRYVILTDGYLLNRRSKTAHGMLRYAKDEIVAIIDREYAGRNISEVMPEIRRSVPIVASVNEALCFAPTSLLIGVATTGGVLPPNFRAHVLSAIDEGLEVVNGLHQLLRDDPELAAHAQRSGAKLWDVRCPPDTIPFFSGAAYSVPQVVVLAVGSDCAVGKKTAMIELASAARKANDAAEFVATGQTGVMISGKGIAVDRVISDFICGAAEQLVLNVQSDAEYALVEGQGSLIHPAYAPVTLGLLFGCAPDLLVLCHETGRASIEDFGVNIPDLAALKTLYEAVAAPVKPAPCVAVCLNTQTLSESEAHEQIAKAQSESGLPADDVVRFGGEKIWSVIRSQAQQTSKWQARNARVTSAGIT